MKKLLAVLGSLGLVASAGSIVVSCKTNNQEDETGTILLDHNGELGVTSEGLLRWYQENVGEGDRVKNLKEFYQYFAVAIFQNADKDDSIFKDLKPSQEANQYALENFQDKLKNTWKEIKQNAEDQLKQKQEDAKDDKSFVDDLAKTFPYVDKDYDKLSNAYKNNLILTDATNGALTRLTKLLASTYSADIQTRPNDTSFLNIFLSKWSQTPMKDAATAIVKVLNSPDSNIQDKINIYNLFNATGGVGPLTNNTSPKSWNLSNITWADKNNVNFSPDNVNDLLTRVIPGFDKTSTNNINTAAAPKTLTNYWTFVKENGDKIRQSNSATFFDLVPTIPVLDNTGAIKLGDNSKAPFGLVTNSQRFLLDQYFQVQKPVSISQVVFKKAEKADLTKQINAGSFFASGTSDNSNWLQYYGLINFLTNYVTGQTPSTDPGDDSGNDNPPSSQAADGDGITSPIKGIGQYNFDTIFGTTSKDNIGKIALYDPSFSDIANKTYWDSSFYETKNEENLLTLSNKDANKTLKFSVYDFLQSQITTPYQLTSEGKPADVTGVTASALSAQGIVSSDVADNIHAAIENLKTENQGTVIDALWTVFNLIKALNRTGETATSDGDQSQNTMYKVLNAEQGIIAFMETDGLHIAKINGFDALKKGELQNQKTFIFGDDDASHQAYSRETMAFNRLNAYISNGGNQGLYRYIFQDYNNMIGQTYDNTNGFHNQLNLASVANNVVDYGVKYDDLNKSISNPYERFLINNSVLTSKGTNDQNPAFYKFDIFKELQNSITNSSDNENALSANPAWLWTYIQEILGPKAADNKSLLENFVDFGKGEEASQYERNLVKSLQLSQDKSTDSPGIIFRQGWQDWDDEIDAWNDGSNDANQPLVKLSTGDADSHVNNIISLANFQPFKGATYNIDYSVNYENYSLVTNATISANDPKTRHLRKGEK